ncbi:probable pectinesterase 66 [Impatiens glandulifera]|uniref:probable pectinesterase 66 n=1 Tax=Impatiens glandulifera TaxID=253017 RepID=UPI001FB0EE7F|nr:probable pectinesterase 66 [Impatiens glandulifera]
MGFSLFPIAFVIILFFPCILAYEFASTIIVDQSGKGQFKTIQDAINSVPSGNNKWFRIDIYPGIYNENVFIPAEKEYLFLQGSNLSQTIISSDVHTSSLSATFRSSANNLVAKNIKFVNSYNINQKINIIPAPAATIYGDKIAFYNCEFVGYQNTLADARGRHYYKSCHIEGALDFIWGWGQTVFEECKIKVTGEPDSRGYITAQGRESVEDSNGFVFLNCDVDGVGKAYLGRAYGASSRVVFIKSTLSSVVIPMGWDAWVHKDHKGDLTYVEAGCRGSGANSLERECKINVTGVPNSKGYITAQGRESKDDPNGFVFLKCDVDGIGQAYLGKPYGSFSRVIFIQSTMSSVVIPAGWDAWVHQGFEGDLTYLEAGCRGSGANSLQRVPWAWIMSYNRVYLEQFNPQNFNDKDGWIANTLFK